jgi:hypothetical protein
MPSIGLLDIDPLIAERVREKDASTRKFSAFSGIGDTLRASAATDPEQKRILDAELSLLDTIKSEPRPIEPLKTKWSYILGVALIGCSFLALPLSRISTSDRDMRLLISFSGLPCLIFGLLLIIKKIFNNFPILNSSENRLYIPNMTLIAILRTMGRSKIEGMYSQATAEVISAEETLGSETARELLNSLNELLLAARRLESEKNVLDGALSGQSLAEIETERDMLSTRRDATGDEMARETLSESLALCEARLGRARALAPVHERVEAQLGGISQTMRSVQSSVAALRIAPGETDLSALQETARNLTQKTYAIESAVQEVLRLR